MWARVLVNKVRNPYKKLDALYECYLAPHIHEQSLKDERYVISQAKYNELAAAISEFENEIHQQWMQGIESVSMDRLGEKLLVRVDPDLV